VNKQWNLASQMDESPVSFTSGNQLSLIAEPSKAAVVLKKVDLRNLSDSSLKVLAWQSGVPAVKLKQVRSAVRSQDCPEVDPEDVQGIRDSYLHRKGPDATYRFGEGRVSLSELPDEVVIRMNKNQPGVDGRFVKEFNHRYGTNIQL